MPKWVIKKLDRGETVEAYLYCTKGKPYLVYDKWFGYRLIYKSVDVGISAKKYASAFTRVLNGLIPVKVGDRWVCKVCGL